MTVIVVSKRKKNSVFEKCLKRMGTFNPNDPEFVKALRKKNEETKAWFDDFKRREQENERYLASMMGMRVRSRQ